MTLLSEVKSGRGKDTLAGMEAFSSTFKPQKKLLVGGSGIPVEEFLSTPVMELGGVKILKFVLEGAGFVGG